MRDPVSGAIVVGCLFLLGAQLTVPHLVLRRYPRRRPVVDGLKVRPRVPHVIEPHQLW